jgi:hypothetical protein
MKRKKSKRGNLRLAIAFVLCIFALIFLSLSYKAFLVLKNSKYDEQDRFTIGVYGKGTPEVLSFSPQTHTVVILKTDGFTNQNLGQALEVPVDAVIVNPSLSINKKNLTQSLLNILLNFKANKTTLNTFDSIKLLSFSATTPPSSIYESNVSLQSDRALIEQRISRLFNYQTIIFEKSTIEIQNGTDISGLGSRLATFISNMGGDVILVSTSDKQISESKIYYNRDKNYTVSKLGDALGFGTVKATTNSIADIKIIIGEDSLGNLRF